MKMRIAASFVVGTMGTITAFALAAGLERRIAISAGAWHTCEIKRNVLYCQGRNDQGQLGNGSISGGATTVPTVVTAVWGSAALSAVGAGAFHSCAVANATTYCWGNNSYGQLGIGFLSNNSPVPSMVQGLPVGDNVDVAGGYYHSCALIRNGSNGGWVRCWGYNAYGQLGNGLTSNSSVPVTLGANETIYVAIATGQYHSCAVTSIGQVHCWGNNADGQLGNGTTTNSSVPVLVSGLSGVTSIAAGAYHTCANSSGQIYCWGSNTYGQLGDGTTISRKTPTATLAPSNSTRIACGEYHSCSVKHFGVPSDGVYCWGRNDSGQLGINSTADQYSAVKTSGHINFGQDPITAGSSGRHTCAVSGPYLHCFGRNDYGQLGIGSTANSLVPVPMSL